MIKYWTVTMGESITKDGSLFFRHKKETEAAQAAK